MVAAAFRRGAGLPHRPLPGQAGGAEPDGAALRQRAVRAAVAAREHRQHPDHAGRGHRRGHARRLLRPHRRAARHGAEPCAAAADDDRDGAAADRRRRRHPRREAQGAALAEALHARERGARRGARPVQGRHRRRQGRCRVTWTKPRCRPAAAARPSSRCAPRCRTGAGPACPSTCAPASGWPARDAHIVVNFRDVPHPIFPGANRRQQAGHQAAARGRAGAAPAGGQGQRAGDELLAPVSLDLDFDKAFCQRARRRLRAPAARRHRRAAEPVRAQRRAGAGLALGRAGAATPGPSDPSGPRPYAAGSWGPAAASALVARDGCAWAEEQ